MALFNSQHFRNLNIVFAELLPEILKNCTDSDLLELRLVNRQWREVATRTLLKRRSFKILFELCPKLLECRSGGGLTFYAFNKTQTNRSSLELCEEHCNLDIKTRKETDFKRRLPDFFRLLQSPPIYQPCASYSSWTWSSSCSLPVNHFSFLVNYVSSKSSTPPQLLSFVQTFGPKLTALTLDSFVPYFVGQPGMPDFLLQYTPNLESLHILDKNYDRPSNLELESTKNSSIGKKIKFILSSLKFIEIRYSASEFQQLSWATLEILAYLMKTAPRLEQVSFPCLSDLRIVKFFNTGLSSITLLHIESLHLSEKDLFFEGLENLQVLIEMMTKKNRDSSTDIGVKHFRIQVERWPNTRNGWNLGSLAFLQIIQLNQNSLQEIELHDAAASIIHKIPGIPALNNVTKLSIRMNEHYEGEPYYVTDWFRSNNDDGHSPHSGNSLSDLFPNLEKLELIKHDVVEDFVFDSRFPLWNDKLRRVTNLKVHFHELWEDNLIGYNNYDRALELCPEVTTFSAGIWEYDHFPVRMTPLWNLTQLTSLRLEFDLYDPINMDTCFDLDAAITGLSMKTVLAINTNWLEFGRWELPKPEEEQHQSRSSSLLCLKNLRKLNLEFGFLEDLRPRMLLSGISAKFAFDLMENLEVLVSLKRGTMSDDCHGCAQDWAKENEEWLKFHEPLLANPEVNMTISSARRLDI